MAEQAVKAREQADPEASPLNGVVPPKEHRWKPGQSGNPQGRRLSSAIEAKLAEKGRPERLVESILAKIESEGDVSAFKEIIARHEGHVPTKSETYTENYYLIEEVAVPYTEDTDSP